MDSLATKDQAKIPPERLFKIAEQDSTDFDKALRSISAPFVLGVGFLGGRADHQLGNFAVLVRRDYAPCVLIGSEDVVFAAPSQRLLSLELIPGERVSLFPMQPVTGRSEGLVWPIEGIDFEPHGRIGTLNRTDTGHVRLFMDGPGMLVLLERRALRAALQALAVTEI